MAIPVKLQVFEGPLDLLLHLITINKIDIYDIPIADITDQYLEYIRDMDMEDIAFAIESCTNYKMSIGEYLDLMMVWYRDILMLKVTGKYDKLIFQEEYSTIKDQAKYLSYNELEDKARAVENAKKRIDRHDTNVLQFGNKACEIISHRICN